VTNKHLLPVYDLPMIYYPVQALVNAGIRDIVIVTGGNNAGDFVRLLANGRDFGLRHLNFTYQEGEGGIADALRLAEPFVEGERICVILGDNIIENNVIAAAQQFERQEKGAHILLKEVADPERFGCPEIRDGRLIRIEEKPRQPPSRYAVTGIYFYDASVFEKIGRLKPSWRQELEITDVNNMYLDEGALTYSVLQGWWTDAGTFDSLRRATSLVAETGANKVNGVVPRVRPAQRNDE
jgi:glucose-1-phosphate thymidylyltransferase